MKKQRPRRKSKFLKWADGDTLVVTLRVDMPEEVLKHWSGGRSYVCTGLKQGCTYCLAGDEPRTRWRFPVTQAGELKAWDLSNTVWEQLEAVADEPDSYKGLSFKVTRKGAGFNTVYIILPSTEEQSGPEPPSVDALQQRVLGLSSQLNKPAKELVATFLAGPGRDWADAEPQDQLAALVPWLEQLMSASPSEESEEPEPEQIDLLDMF